MIQPVFVWTWNRTRFNKTFVVVKTTHVSSDVLKSSSGCQVYRYDKCFYTFIFVLPVLRYLSLGWEELLLWKICRWAEERFSLASYVMNEYYDISPETKFKIKTDHNNNDNNNDPTRLTLNDAKIATKQKLRRLGCKKQQKIAL